MRYTLDKGDSAVGEGEKGLDKGKPTGAYAKEGVGFGDACKVVKGHFYGGEFTRATFKGGEFTGGD